MVVTEAQARVLLQVVTDAKQPVEVNEARLAGGTKILAVEWEDELVFITRSGQLELQRRKHGN